MNLAKKLLAMLKEEEDDSGKFTTGPFEFYAEEQDGPRIMGTVKYKGKDFHGFIGYDEDEGVEWEFDPEVEPENDEDMDHWIDLVMEVVGDYQLAYAADQEHSQDGDNADNRDTPSETLKQNIREAARKIWNR
jgi:hypothetical protein